MSNDPIAPTEAQEQPTPAMEFGRKLVGATFNPSKNPDVDRVKNLAAGIAALVYEYGHSKGDPLTYDQQLVVDGTLMDIYKASSSAVKVLTYGI